MKIYNGWQVAVDLCYNNGENMNLLNSPLFENEEDADKWYRDIDMYGSEWENICDGVDFIMLKWKNGKVEDTYIL